MQSETLFTFPCQFPLKVVGHGNADFETLVLDLIRKHIPTLDASAVRAQPSKSGKYIALTVTLTAESKEQLDAIYRELTSNKNVVMAL